MNNDCVFCRIAAAEIPADVVGETENVLAFRDVNPAAPVHVLLIPKRHIADSASDLTTDDGAVLGELFELAARVAGQSGLDGGWRIVNNVGAGAGQTVFHLHFHLLGGWDGRHSAPRLADEAGG